MVKVQILYASADFEEFIASVFESSANFKKNEIIYVVLDYLSFPKIDYFSCIDISESCLLKIPKKTELHDLPRILPMIKYGTISCYIIQKYNIDSNKKIVLDMPNNIRKLMMNFFKQKTLLIYNDIKQKNDLLIRFQNNILDIFENNQHKAHIDFNFKNLIDVFEKSNVEKVIKYVVDKSMLADIIYLHRGESLTSSGSQRFFDVIEWKEICI